MIFNSNLISYYQYYISDALWKLYRKYFRFEVDLKFDFISNDIDIVLYISDINTPIYDIKLRNTIVARIPISAQDIRWSRDTLELIWKRTHRPVRRHYWATRSYYEDKCGW